MIKLVLSLLLIVVSSLIGNSLSMRISNRKKTLSYILSAINRIKTLICFGGMDTPRVVEECFCTVDFPLLKSEILNSTTDYYKGFEDCVSKINNSFSLTKSDKKLLSEFGLNLGTTDVAGQVAHTELYAQLFAERLSSVKEQEIAKSKLYRVLGFSVGCAVSLLVV